MLSFLLASVIASGSQAKRQAIAERLLAYLAFTQSGKSNK